MPLFTFLLSWFCLLSYSLAPMLPRLCCGSLMTALAQISQLLVGSSLFFYGLLDKITNIRQQDIKLPVGTATLLSLPIMCSLVAKKLEEDWLYLISYYSNIQSLAFSTLSMSLAPDHTSKDENSLLC